MKPSLAEHLQRIVEIDKRYEDMRERGGIYYVRDLQDLKRERRSHVAAIQNAPRGNTR